MDPVTENFVAGPVMVSEATVKRSPFRTIDAGSLLSMR
jgi:hypothetical protein